MQKKIIRRRTISTAVAPVADVHPVLARVYAGRGVTDSRELSCSLQNLQAPCFLGQEVALTLLEQALRAQRRLLVIGDFDADGATSVTLSVLALRAMGAQQVDYLVPNRFEYGYGLTPEIVALAFKEKRPELIITVDNGISSFDGVAAARSAGVPVLVTDHHLAGDVLPEADAIINPNQPGCPFPSKHLAGVGVVFYLLSALRSRLKENGWFDAQGLPVPNMADYLDIVALGTVADVVPLDQNNRILVYQGLSRIRRGLCRPGISALLKVAKRKRETLCAADLGFAVAPRLNAAGRLDDMAHGIECLLTDSVSVADTYAAELDALNQERREIEYGMQQEALSVLRHIDLNAELPYGISLYDRHWHQGVIGILAGRIKDQYHRPTIVFAPGEPGFLKGSARSIPGVHIRDVLDYLATRHPGLITKFGGHAMAAGLALPETHWEKFRIAFDEAVKTLADAESLDAVVLSDGELSAADIDESLAKVLRDGGPWGQAFTEPVFDGEFLCLEQRLLQEKHLKLSLCHPQGNRPVDAIFFNVNRQRWPNAARRVRAAYRLDLNEFRGMTSVQLQIQYLEALDG